MVVINRNRVTAIVIRHDGGKVVLVPMTGGKLSALHLSARMFHEEWQETDYALTKALDVFLSHASERGASRETLSGLKRLRERDRVVVAPLF